MSPSSDRALPAALRWHPEWFTDPVPEWWLQRLDDRIIKELVASQLRTNIRMLELQQQALKIQIEEMKGVAETLAR